MTVFAAVIRITCWITVLFCITGCQQRSDEPAPTSRKGAGSREIISPYSGGDQSFWRDENTVVTIHSADATMSADIIEWPIGAAVGNKINSWPFDLSLRFCFSDGNVYYGTSSERGGIGYVSGPAGNEKLIPGSNRPDFHIPPFLGGTVPYPRVNAFQCKISEQSDIEALSSRRNDYTFTGLHATHGYLAGPKASSQDYMNRAARTQGWTPPKPRPIYLMYVDGRGDVELGVTACDLPNQFSISYSAIKGKYLLRPFLKMESDLFEGCHPYFQQGSIQVFWFDPNGAIEAETIVLPELREHRNYQSFRLFWTKIGWVALDGDRILRKSNELWIPLYESPKDGHPTYSVTSVSPDGCKLGLQLFDFEPRGSGRVRWFSKQFRVVDLCSAMQ